MKCKSSNQASTDANPKANQIKKIKAEQNKVILTEILSDTHNRNLFLSINSILSRHFRQMNSSYIFKFLVLALTTNVLIMWKEVAVKADDDGPSFDENLQKFNDEERSDETHKIVKKDGTEDDSINFLLVNGKINIGNMPSRRDHS